MKSFGPAVHHEDGRLRASCTYCCFRISLTCTHIKPSRAIADPRNTPDFCEFKTDMLRETEDEIAKKATRQ